MRFKELIGMQVLDIDATNIGKVKDVEFSSKTGQIEKILASEEKNILSSDEKKIPYSNIKEIGDYILLK